MAYFILILFLNNIIFIILYTINNFRQMILASILHDFNLVSCWILSNTCTHDLLYRFLFDYFYIHMVFCNLLKIHGL